MAIFAAVAAVHAFLATSDHRLSDGQTVMATAALRASGAADFAADPLYGQEGQAPSPSPAFSGAVAAVMSVCGIHDPVVVLRILVAPIMLIYLVSMYALLYRQCLSWSVATFVAVLSVVLVPAMGGSSWGLGTLASVGPWGICVALTPLVALAFLDASRPAARWWRLPAVFLLLGLLGNFDLSWAMNLSVVLAACLIAGRRFSLAGWMLAVGMLIAAAIGAMPAVGRLLAARAGGTISPQAVAACWQVLREGDGAVLYPQAIRSLADWLPWAGPLAVFAVVVLTQLGQFQVANLMFWIVFAAGAAILSFAFQAASQLVGAATGGLPPITGFIKASSMLMLPVYALSAQALTGLFRMGHGHRGLLRAVCAVAAAGWLIPSDNLRLPRQWAYQLSGALMDEESRPRRIQRIQDAADRHSELAAIGRWARTNTVANSVFVTDSSEFRLLSHRSLVAGAEDGVYLCCWRAEEVPTWRRRLADQERLLHPAAGQTDPAAVSSFVGEQASHQPLSAAGAWYVVISASTAPQAGATLTEETSDGWGKYYRVYRVR